MSDPWTGRSRCRSSPLCRHRQSTINLERTNEMIRLPFSPTRSIRTRLLSVAGVAALFALSGHANAQTSAPACDDVRRVPSRWPESRPQPVHPAPSGRRQQRRRPSGRPGNGTTATRATAATATRATAATATRATAVTATRAMAATTVTAAATTTATAATATRHRRQRRDHPIRRRQWRRGGSSEAGDKTPVIHNNSPDGPRSSG